ncbi:hypothetical protein LMG27174_05362 [Paraburkholderia rhynchosiae]|uniref:Uncharacterized protein n=1 Tax=Paraburkholderia rhynchosiae TaxID=487049 RepID=A0A6J5C3Q0_9BURK|nr:hypothetical protein LMG27174_05362 [Paraburkholderia rhynchosiae]
MIAFNRCEANSLRRKNTGEVLLTRVMTIAY